MNFKPKEAKALSVLIIFIIIGCDALQFEPTIEPPSITVTSPNGGEAWEPGNIYTITWTSENLSSSNVSIKLYESGSFYTTIDGSESNDGSYNWNIPTSYDESDYYKIRISDSDDSNVYDESDSYFTLLGSITVTSPNGGENWELGSTHTITWSENISSSYVIIQLYKSGSFNTTISGHESNDDSYNWSIPTSYDESDNYKIRISNYYDSNVYGESDSYFSISAAPSITVISPNGGEAWEPSSSHTITWTSENLSSSNVSIKLYESGSFYTTIDGSESNDGSYNWNIPTYYDLSDNYKIRISDYYDSNVYDESDDYFSISAAPSITVTSPNGGEDWEPGSSHTITWSSENLSSNYVSIKLYKSGSYVSTLSSSTSDNGSYTWSISSNQTESNYYKVRIEEYNNSSIYDESDDYFSLSSTSSWATLFTQSGDQGNQWHYDETIDLSAYAGYTITFRFYGETGSGYESDMAIDNVRLYDNGSLMDTESFELSSGWLYDNVTGDDYDWTRSSGGTNSNSTGPSSASSGSYYVYTEASDPGFPSKDFFLERTLNLTSYSNPQIKFDYHMYGSDMGTLRVQVVSQ